MLSIFLLWNQPLVKMEHLKEEELQNHFCSEGKIKRSSAFFGTKHKAGETRALQNKSCITNVIRRFL